MFVVWTEEGKNPNLPHKGANRTNTNPNVVERLRDSERRPDSVPERDRCARTGPFLLAQRLDGDDPRANAVDLARARPSLRAWPRLNREIKHAGPRPLLPVGKEDDAAGPGMAGGTVH